jgi:beta-N-acetylhexosaminidase
MKNYIKSFILLAMFLVATSFIVFKDVEPTDPEFLIIKTPWADSIFGTLTSQEKLAQLFMVAAYSNKDATHIKKIDSLIIKNKIGGLIFFQGGPVRQANMINHFQSISKIPMAMAIDGEWGMAMRLDSTIEYPKQMTLGALQDDSLIYKMGVDIASQCKMLGMQINFAPVVDVNNNINNPVIGFRSFGESKYKVAQKGIAYIGGMQSKKVLGTAKHFPGHGDTETDSHKDLPIINHSKNRLDSIELYPFKEIFKSGAGGVMVAHLNIPVLDNTVNLPSTLSKPIVTGLLKEQMGFNGLVFTDALDMKGVSKYYAKGVVDAKAMIAGNDVMLFSEDVAKAMEMITAAIEKGEITQEEIDKRCIKILKFKEWSGLHQWKPIETNGLKERLNSNEFKKLNKKLFESALTVLKNDGEILPIKNIDTLKIASVVIGSRVNNEFQTMLSKFAEVKNYEVAADINNEEIQKIKLKLAKYDLVIIGLHGLNNSPSKNFGVQTQTINLINEISKQNKVILDVFGNPYSVSKIQNLEKVQGLIVSYQDNKITRESSAQLIMGALTANGKLPVSVSKTFIEGSGIDIEKTIRLKFSNPDDTGLNEKYFMKIDSIVNTCIDKQVFPGCQIFVAYKGNIVYNKSFGYHTYEREIPVSDNDIYDLASITKMAATTAVFMKLDDEKKFSLNKNLCDYLKFIPDTSAYLNLNMRDIMAHQAGFVAWIPYFESTIDAGGPMYKYYRTEQSDSFPTKVAKDLFIRYDYSDSIFNKILSTPLRRSKDYLYSDLGFYFSKLVIEKLEGKSLDDVAYEKIYKPLGFRRTGYLPQDRFPLNEIVPTEYDYKFRKQLVHGDVHDQGAAMLGGVSGHAGLFGNATELGIFMQMLLNGGVYGGKRILSDKVIKEYTACQSCKSQFDKNRRGAGFDKPVKLSDAGPTCQEAPFSSFGHTGFTGTMAWGDPENDLVYVFLSNRVYPIADNKKLIKLGIRSEIQKLIYQAISSKKETASIAIVKKQKIS